MTQTANVAKNRFLFFLDKISKILESAQASEDVANFIYTNDMRTPLFMLEGLCRIYKKIYEKSGFKKLNARFKELEDKLGEIDYYDGFFKEFQTSENIPSALTFYTKEKKEEKMQSLNSYLKKEKWIGKHQKAIANVLKKLNKVDWMDEKDDAKAVFEVYQNDILKILKRYKNRTRPFSDIENDVHELRRELRWLSIYPQALLGLIQMQRDDEVPETLNKYLSPEIINSPFNKMPAGSGLQVHILLHQNYYFALSWIIAELGKLKDQGLKIELLEAGISSIYKTKKDVSSLAYALCENTQPPILQILNEAQKISNTFFAENILEHLVVSLYKH